MQQQHLNHQQQQQQQEALFTSTIWTPHLRGPLDYQQQAAGAIQQQQVVPPLFNQQQQFNGQLESGYPNDGTQFQQVVVGPNDAKHDLQQQQQHLGNGNSLLLVGLSLVVTCALVGLILLTLAHAPATNSARLHQLAKPRRLARQSARALRGWLMALGSSQRFNQQVAGRRCLHESHLRASECAKCCHASASQSPDESCSAASPWPIIVGAQQAGGSAASSTTNSSRILGTLRPGPMLQSNTMNFANSSSIIVGLNPIARNHQQHHQQTLMSQTAQMGQLASKTLSSHIKQQLCFATQASKVGAAAMQLDTCGGSGGYYSAMNYAGAVGDTERATGGAHFVGPLGPYTTNGQLLHQQQQQPPTADLLGTGYQCQQAFAQMQPSLYHMAAQQQQQQQQQLQQANSGSQTTRLVWQQATNEQRNNSATNGYLIDGGTYMPLSSSSSGGGLAGPAGQATRGRGGVAGPSSHSGSGSPIYQTIYG